MTGIRSIAAIALGSNLNFREFPPEITLRHAIESIAEYGLVIRAISRFYATPCFPAGAGPDYINAAITVATDLTPPALLDILHEIEARFQRQREQRWGMRTLDLDILWFEDSVVPDVDVFQHWCALSPDLQRKAAPDRLVLPHPRMQDRGFVLVPAMDIAPGWVHPVLGKSIKSLTKALPPEDIAVVTPI